jgi:hypothetical protein
LKSGWIAIFFYPGMNLITTDLTPMLCSITINMIEREKFNYISAATTTSATAIGIKSV